MLPVTTRVAFKENEGKWVARIWHFANPPFTCLPISSSPPPSPFYWDRSMDLPGLDLWGEKGAEISTSTNISRLPQGILNLQERREGSMEVGEEKGRIAQNFFLGLCSYQENGRVTIHPIYWGNFDRSEFFWGNDVCVCVWCVWVRSRIISGRARLKSCQLLKASWVPNLLPPLSSLRLLKFNCKWNPPAPPWFHSNRAISEMYVTSRSTVEADLGN